MFILKIDLQNSPIGLYENMAIGHNVRYRKTELTDQKKGKSGQMRMESGFIQVRARRIKEEMPSGKRR